jgi:hypothetical protein
LWQPTVAQGLANRLLDAFAILHLHPMDSNADPILNVARLRYKATPTHQRLACELRKPLRIERDGGSINEHLDYRVCIGADRCPSW